MAGDGDISGRPTERSPLLDLLQNGAACKPQPSVVVAADLGLDKRGRCSGLDQGQDQDGDGEAMSPQPPQPPPPPRPNVIAVFMAAAVGLYLVALGQLLPVATYAKIGSDLHALNKMSWITTAYSLTLTSFQPLYGKLSDIFGRKQCLLFAYSVFGLGCLGCGLAGHIDQLIVARAVSGVGGGGMNSVVAIVLTDLVPLRERGAWQGAVSVVVGIGTATGLPLGGLLADSVGWRWSFLGQLPICLAAFVAVSVVLRDLPKPAAAATSLPNNGDDDGDGDGDHDDRKPGSTITTTTTTKKPNSSTTLLEKLHQVDFPGAVCLVAAISTLLLGLDHGSNKGWGRTSTLASLAASLVLFALFAVVETKVAAHPIAPMRVLFDKALVPFYSCNFFCLADQMPIYFFLPLLYQAYHGMSAADAGLLISPAAAGSMIAALGSGFAIRRTGRYYWLLVASVCLALLSHVPLVLLSGAVADSRAGTTAGLVLSCFGVQAAITINLVGAVANSKPADTAVVIALTYLFRCLGISVGVIVMSAVLQFVLRRQLAARLGGGGGEDGDGREEAERISQRVRESLDYIKELEPGLAGVVRECYRVAVTSVFAASSVLAVLALVSALMVHEKKIK